MHSKVNSELGAQPNANTISRRLFVQSAASAAVSTVALAAPMAMARNSGSAHGKSGKTGPENCAGLTTVLDTENIAETMYGKVRGSEHGGIHIFRGIPYGDTTAGSNRFLPAKAPKPWSGVRSALWFEQVCPAAPRDSWAADELAYVAQWDDGWMGEDMLRVNVWTPSIRDSKKRPVMVWMHGGGFSTGSGQEQPAYDGEMLARSGDVVVISFNHRLNAFGFLNLAELGPEFAESGNVGMTDIVFLLQWVRDNAAAFGGDPGNVTIMGQSGGGGKVNTLMAMPSAQGLFHKASVHSGSMLNVMEPDRSLRLAHALLQELDITGSNIEKRDKLRAVPWNKLALAADAATNAIRKAGMSGGAPDARTMSRSIGWGPYLDGSIIPQQTWTPGAPEMSATVPLMVGNVLNEFAVALGQPDAFAMTREEMMKKLTQRFGVHAEEIAAAFEQGHPGANPFQIQSIVSACGFRSSAMTQAKRKAALGKAPAYAFWFQWQTPILSGRPMAFHCSDLNFFFNNVERGYSGTGNTPVAQRLGAQMSEAWIAFARTGNPNHPGIPRWEPVTLQGSETMIFDTQTRFSATSDAKERALFEAIPPPGA